jgi:hypothetical protein
MGLNENGEPLEDFVPPEDLERAAIQNAVPPATEEFDKQANENLQY